MEVDVTLLASYVCSSWTCVPCPSGTGNCVHVSGQNLIWNDNGLGPLWSDAS